MPQHPPRRRRFVWRPFLYQVLFALLVLLLVGWLARNTLHNMQLRGIQSGFDFLWQPAGFDIGESLLDYDAGQAYWQAFLVGLLNTLRVALPACLLTTVLGTLLGAGRDARHPLVRGMCALYVELFRNTPLLLQLLMSYLLLAQLLPPLDSPWQLGPLGLSKNGLAWLTPPYNDDELPQALMSLTPEFLALLLGLTLYTSAFAAEVVRAGIAAVPVSQKNAAAALGLTPRQTLHHVVLPQALRLMVPPMTNQYLNLTKNSSLAVAIGYPDLLSIANTAINQTGRAVEGISIIMLIYLSISLGTAWLMGRFNARTLRHSS